MTQTPNRFFATLLRAFLATAAFTLSHFAAGQTTNSPVLVVGGASHTQSGFSDARIQRFYTATAAKAAEQMSEAFDKRGVKNSKFIVWSRYEQYQQEIGFNLAACDCGFLMQVSFGKNVDANPQTFFLEYELSLLEQSKQTQPGFTSVITRPRFNRRFEIPITDEIFQEGKFPNFADEIALTLIQSKAFTSNKTTK